MQGPRSPSSRCTVLVMATVFAMAGCEGPVEAGTSRAVRLPSADSLGPKTTRGQVAVQNLEAQLRALQAREAAGTLKATDARRLVELRIARAQFLGRWEDDLLALESADRHVQALPQLGAAHALRATVRARLHDFSGALGDLETARGLGAQIPAAQQAAVRWAQGDRSALPILEAAAADQPSFETLSTLAGALVEARQLERAEALYAQARQQYRDVSPFALSWLDFQEGLLHEAAGDLHRAGERWARAYVRLPQYAAAAGHLAEVEAAFGHHQRVVELLEPFVRATQEPSLTGQLGASLLELGRRSEAAALIEAARSTFEHLLGIAPLAYADHAARFYLGPGQDPARALELATLNASSRPTVEACALYAEAARAAQVPPAPCP